MSANLADALSASASSVLCDARIEAVVAAIRATYRPAAADTAPDDAALSSARGELMYLLCRALRARCVVDAGASLLSILYLAAAVRDNGGGRVLAAQIAPGRVAATRCHLLAAGLDSFVELRPATIGHDLDDVDFVRIGRSEAISVVAQPILRQLAPRLQGGAIVLLDHAEDGSRAWLRDPLNGFRAMGLSLDGYCELAVRAR